MINKTILCLFLLLSLALTASSLAQEAQVPMDEEGKLDYIDSKLEQQLGLFTQYQNFQEARLFQVSDTSFVLEISYQPGEQLLKERLPLSANETFEFRRKVTERIKHEKPEVVLDQEGRSKLIAGSLALSMGYYGWAVPVMFDLQDGKTISALYMLISGAGFFIPLTATRHKRVTDGEATFSLYGGTRGIVHGIFTYGLISGKDASEREAVGAGMVGSLAEAITFFALANKSNMRPGKAEVIGIGGDFGLGLGLGTAHLANFFDDDKERSLCASIVLGSGAGLLAGKFLADRQPYTRGDAYVLRGAGMLGAYLPVAAVDLAKPKDDKTYTSAAMAGAVVGLGVGHFLVRGKDFTTGQGKLLNLGELAGGLVGLGVAHLVSSDEHDRSLYLVSSAVGATAGFWLLYWSFAEDARTQEKSTSWNIRFAPEGLFAYALSKRFKQYSELAIPIGKFEYRF